MLRVQRDKWCLDIPTGSEARDIDTLIGALVLLWKGHKKDRHGGVAPHPGPVGHDRVSSRATRSPPGAVVHR